MTTDPFEYDLALSFAGKDKPVVEQFADLLRKKALKVFYDEYKPGDPGGKDVLDHLVNLYARKARYVVLFISENYPLRSWTEADRTSAGERALRDADEYIVPLLLDGNAVPGLAQAKGYRDLRQHAVEEIVTWLEEKLRELEARSGPPSQSHDLRSGNVPDQEN